MTRTQNIKKNLIFNLLKFVIQLVLQFVLRTILIYYMGVEYLGINGLYTNIFAFLNLAELGIGSAIVFSMYQPIADGNIEKIKSLQNLYKKFYLYIFLIVLVVGGMITPFIKYFINGEVKLDINIYLLFVMYLVNTLVGYLSAHKRSLLFAFQRNDLENKVRTICIIGMTILQSIVIILFKNYYLFFTINIISTLVECVLIHFVANKYFPEINGKSVPIDSDTKKSITKNIAALSLHKIGGTIVFSTDNILISTFCSIAILGAYSNYNLIVTSIFSIFCLFYNSLLGSVGNLINTSSLDYVYDRFNKIKFCFVYLCAFSTICLIVLFQPFMLLWTKGGEFLLGNASVLLISVNFYFQRMRDPINVFREAAGLFWYDRWRPIAEAIVNLVVSIVLAQFMGINGIFIGTIVSTLVAPFWVEPYVLYKHYFKRSVGDYFKRYILDALIMIAGAVICYFVCSFIPDGGIWWLILKFATCIILSNVILIIAYMPTKEFKDLWQMGKNMLKTLFKRKKKKV